MKKRRQSLPPVTLTAAENSLAKNFETLLKDPPITAQRAAGYLETGGEIALGSSLGLLRDLGISTSVPVIVGDTMRFAPLTETTPLRRGKYDILIPEYNDAELLDAAELDLVLVPLVAFDNQGNRIGMGGGYYDRTFAHLRNKDERTENTQMLIGVGHEFQKLAEVPTESWDVPLHMAVTDQGIYKFS